MHVRLDANGMDLILKGYFSDVFAKWCVALPSAYVTKEIAVEIQTVEKQVLQLIKPAMESEINVSIEGISYPIHFLCEDSIDTIYITLADQKDLSYVHENKYEEIPGFMTIFEQDGRISQTVLRGFYGHGNDSWKEEKKSYNLKFDDYDSNTIVSMYKDAPRGQQELIIQMIRDKRLNAEKVDANVMMELGKLTGIDFLGMEPTA